MERSTEKTQPNEEVKPFWKKTMENERIYNNGVEQTKKTKKYYKYREIEQRK